MKPRGPFNLLHQNQYFNGWPVLSADPTTIVMAFPVEGWSDSAAVTLHQQADGTLDIKVYGTKAQEQAKQQALAAMSLDEDGSGWPDVGKRDDFVAELQAKYESMRPTLFNSPYESAAAFIIGHRITIAQARKLRATLSEEMGEAIDVEGEVFYAFPTPQKLLTLENFKGLNETKVSRLHAVAEAALKGKLDRDYLRGLDDDVALAELETLPGVGPFFSQGILYRGVGKPDSLTHDDMTYRAIKEAYKLKDDAPTKDILAVAEKWRPYRMWVIVLLHVWLRESGKITKRTFSKK